MMASDSGADDAIMELTQLTEPLCSIQEKLKPPTKSNLACKKGRSKTLNLRGLTRKASQTITKTVLGLLCQHMLLC